jgi:hypothetical protein
MAVSLLERFQKYPKDVFFVGLILLCLLLVLGGVLSDVEKRELLAHGGARKIDLVIVKKQISDGTLSSHKALFYKRLSP